MSPLTPDQILADDNKRRQEPLALTPRSVASIRSSLTEFGYTGLTDEQIADGGRHLLAGGEPRDIIETFMRGMLRDAGLLNEEATDVRNA